MKFLRVIVGKTIGLPELGIAYSIVGEWVPPAALNDPTFGGPSPDEPKKSPLPKLKMGLPRR